MKRVLVVVALISTLSTTRAETVKDREGAVRGDRAKMESSERWIYNDIEAGFAEARSSGKPLMVVLRCVPCLACAGIDAEVLVENAELTPLMDQFVRVRVIDANSLDLSRFQFDYDLSFTTMFFNADGTVYARYGSWEHQYDSQNRATESFRQTLEDVIKLHGAYPANRSLLEGKQAPALPYETPLDIPALDDRYRSELDWKGNVVKSCVHCHQIGDALRRTVRDRGENLTLSMIYPFPTPETIGLQLSDDSVRVVEAVVPDSPAARAGLQAGSLIASINGQVPVSAADYAWALHQFPDQGTLPLVVNSAAGDPLDIRVPIELENGWRAAGGMAKRVGTWPMRRMAFGGMKLDEMEPDDARARGIPAGGLALLAAHVGQYGDHALAKKQGFQQGDIIVEVDGDRSAMSEGELMADILLHRKIGDRIPAVVLRGQREISLKIRVQ